MSAWKALLRDLLSEGLHATGATRVERRLARRLTVLTFHRVLPAELREQYPFPGLAVTPEELRWILELVRRDCELLPVTQAWRRHQESDSRAPLVAISFDDGQLDNYEFARPVLDALGVKATFYIPTNAIDDGDALWHDRMAFGLLKALTLDEARWRAKLSEAGAPVDASDRRKLAAEFVNWSKELRPAQRASWVEQWEQLGGATRPSWDGLMSWQQLRALHNAGHEIGSHSCSHSLLPQCSDEELRSEFFDSRLRLEHALDLRVESFCYPNGSYDARCLQVAREAGYENAVTTAWGYNDRQSDPFALRRCDMQGATSRDRHGKLSSSRVSWRISGLWPFARQ